MRGDFNINQLQARYTFESRGQFPLDQEILI